MNELDFENIVGEFLAMTIPVLATLGWSIPSTVCIGQHILNVAL